MRAVGILTDLDPTRIAVTGSSLGTGTAVTAPATSTSPMSSNDLPGGSRADASAQVPASAWHATIAACSW